MPVADTTTTTGHLQQVDEAFIRRAIDEADLNALRLALYQATGDEDLARMRLEQMEVQGGARRLTVLASEEREPLQQKVIAFVRAGAKPGNKPDEVELDRLMEIFLGRTIAPEDLAFHRTMPAFDDFTHAARWHGAKPPIPEGFHVAIIGAGISGIVTGIQFERLGIPYTIYERRGELGGTWSINTYPDVRVDTSNFIYQYSFEKNYPWSEYFGRQAEVRGYLEHVAKKYGIFDRIRFHSDARSARFDDAAARWTLTIGEGEDAEHVEANVVIAASGLFGVPKTLQVPGVEDFRGQIVHTTDWSEDVIVAGRRVAVIGNGSTGVQLLSRIAREAAQVTVFQRTPQWIAPLERYGAPISSEMRWLLDTIPHFWNWNSYSMLSVGLSQQALQDMDPEWQASGGFINQRNDNFRTSLTSYIKTKLGEREDLIAKVTPDYPPLARRLIVDNGWYEALLRDNVELVPEAIDQFAPEGIRTADGKERPVDLVVAAIGFEATKYVWPMDYFGKNGVSLHDKWDREGTPRAFLGTSIPEFPNLFLHYGPNAQPRAGSLMVWNEIWSRYSAQSVVDLIESGYRAMSVKPEVFEKYNADMDKTATDIIWSEPTSKKRNYYVDANGRSSVNAPWRVEKFYHFFLNQSIEDYILE